MAQDTILVVVWLLNLHQISNVCCLIDKSILGEKGTKAYETTQYLKNMAK